MDVNNRFELLASLPIEEESIISSSIDNNSSEQKMNDDYPIKNCWAIPEYIDKPIPCSTVITTQVKTSPQVKKVKPIVSIPKYEEQQDEAEILSSIQIQSPPIVHSYYPPHPYKLKQNQANNRNQTMPKFHQKINVLPKYTSSRGNSKSCTHQI